MKSSYGSCAILLLAMTLSATAFAVTVVECVDADGTSSFRDKCPPGTEKTGEKKIRGVGHARPATGDEVAEDYPVTLYTVPKCDACDLVRNRLDKRSIPYTEKNVSEDVVLQQELMDVAGSVTVPTVILGEKIFQGYERDALEQGLTAAGYP